MRAKWTKEELAYLLRPVLVVERSYFWEFVIVITIVVMTIIKFG